MGNVRIKVEILIDEIIREENIVFDSKIRDIVKSDISEREKEQRIKERAGLYDNVLNASYVDSEVIDNIDYDEIIDLVEEDLRERGEL